MLLSHFQQRDGHQHSVEQELWLVFTHYSLHSDPSLPEQWRSATFVKFARDCQIVKETARPNSLTIPALELEIAKLVRE
jgi:hypothetical protein